MYLNGFPCLDEWMQAASSIAAAQLQYLSAIATLHVKSFQKPAWLLLRQECV